MWSVCVEFGGCVVCSAIDVEFGGCVVCSAIDVECMCGVWRLCCVQCNKLTSVYTLLSIFLLMNALVGFGGKIWKVVTTWKTKA